MAKGETVSSDAKSEAQWRAESDMRILLDAAEINKDPKRLAAAKACAKKKIEFMKSVAK